MISTTSAAGLVAGSDAQPEKLEPHRVLRPIWLAGERHEVGAVVELGRVLGSELRTAGKVERHVIELEPPKDEAPKAKPEPKKATKKDDA